LFLKNQNFGAELLFCQTTTTATEYRYVFRIIAVFDVFHKGGAYVCSTAGRITTVREFAGVVERGSPGSIALFI